MIKLKNIFSIASIWFVLVFVDLYSKYLAKIYLVTWDLEIFWSFKFSLVFNDWIAFSIPIKWNIQIILTLIFLWIFLFYFLKNENIEKNFQKIAVWFVFWWAIGNLYERFFLWKVTDFIAVFDFFPIFNLADSFVCIWMAMIIFYEIFYKKT